MLLLVKLRFQRAIRIGLGTSSDATGFVGIIHSDTIFSGLLNQLVRIRSRQNTESLINGLRTASPHFRISSAFPYFLEKYYVPAPLGESSFYLEKLKGVPFLELFEFLDLAHGDIEGFSKHVLKKGGPDFLEAITTPRVTVDRITATTNLYEERGLMISEGGGFYFLIDLQLESLRSDLELCIRLLGESGIGGDRSIGFGHFSAEIYEAESLPGWPDLFQPCRGDGEKCFYLLSLCCPAANQEKEALSYTLLNRGGWIFSNSTTTQMKRRSCRMFAEGSLFRSPISGQIVDVTPNDFRPEHCVYRYGLGMMIEMLEMKSREHNNPGGTSPRST